MFNHLREFHSFKKRSLTHFSQSSIPFVAFLELFRARMLTAVHLTICKFVKDSLELYMISVKGKAFGLDHFFSFGENMMLFITDRACIFYAHD